MAEKNLELTSEESEKIKAWLDEKWKDEKCPVCHNSPMLIHDLLAMIPAGKVLGSKQYPCVSVICSECGYMMFFNSILIGINRDSPQQEEGKNEQ